MTAFHFTHSPKCCKFVTTCVTLSSSVISRKILSIASRSLFSGDFLITLREPHPRPLLPSFNGPLIFSNKARSFNFFNSTQSFQALDLELCCSFDIASWIANTCGSFDLDKICLLTSLHSLCHATVSFSCRPWFSRVR